MSTKLIPFVFKNEKTIYATIIDGKEWFVASHVCKALEYTNAPNTIKQHCKNGGIQKKYPPPSTCTNFTNIDLSNFEFIKCEFSQFIA